MAVRCGDWKDVRIYDTPILRDSRESRAAPTRGTDSYVTAFARQGVRGTVRYSCPGDETPCSVCTFLTPPAGPTGADRMSCLRRILFPVTGRRFF